ncbi:exonuclease domain-containing protein [Thalassotalea ganghwensis]
MTHYLPLLHWLNGYEVSRKRALAKAPEGALKHYLSRPLPSPKRLIDTLPLLAVDFETTGLDAINDKLLSIGCVSINQKKIDLSSCYHQVINTRQALQERNVVIHKITDQQQATGCSLKHAIDSLLHALTGKIMLVHFARIEQQFLKQACIELYGMAPPLAVVDTLVVAQRRMHRRDIGYDPSALQLSNLREQYHLPYYSAHNALNDAIATAELYLAQTANMSKTATLSDLLY